MGKHILTKRTALVNPSNKQPMPISTKSLQQGEIVVGYATGHEAIYIKNADGLIVSIDNADKYYEYDSHNLTSLTNLPTDKKTVIVHLKGNETLSLGNAIPQGREMKIIVESDNNFLVTLPDNMSTNLNEKQFVSPKGGCNEITLYSLGANSYYTKTTMLPYKSSFRGITNQGESYNYYLNGSSSSLSAPNNTDIPVTNLIKSTEGMFLNGNNIKSLDLSNFDTSYVTTMEAMFGNCEKLAHLNLNHFNTSQVTNMSGMFGGCLNLVNLDLSNFNTINVQSMWAMFGECSNLTHLDLSSFNTVNVTNMNDMFTDCGNLRYIKLSPSFFATSQTIPFGGATQLGFDEHGNDNGWLAHLVAMTPSLASGETKTIQLPHNLTNATWADDYKTQLAHKGYNIIN